MLSSTNTSYAISDVRDVQIMKRYLSPRLLHGFHVFHRGFGGGGEKHGIHAMFLDFAKNVFPLKKKLIFSEDGFFSIV